MFLFCRNQKSFLITEKKFTPNVLVIQSDEKVLKKARETKRGVK